MSEEQQRSAADTPCGWSTGALVQVLQAHSREIAQRESDAYAYGYAAGVEAGRAQAEAEMDAWWAMLARRIRADAGRARKPLTQPVARRQPDDSIWFAPGELEAMHGDPVRESYGRAA